MGDLEDELACIRKSLQSRSRTESSTSGKTEAASSNTLTSSIAQMTIGVAPPLVATSVIRQLSAALVPTPVATARGQLGAPAKSTNNATAVTRSAVQVATGSPYPVPPPPTRSPLPSNRVSTLLGNVPLSVPPVCATYADHALGREPCNDERRLADFCH